MDKNEWQCECMAPKNQKCRDPEYMLTGYEFRKYFCLDRGNESTILTHANSSTNKNRLKYKMVLTQRAKLDKKMPTSDLCVMTLGGGV